MANTLTYNDLSDEERLAYERIVAQGAASEESADGDGVVTRLFRWTRQGPQPAAGWSILEQFIRMQAISRGYESFDRDSFPDFPAEAKPFVQADEAERGYPNALHDIIETFSNAEPAQRLQLLVSYAGRLPELPEELHHSRDTMEQVDECMIPVFLSAQLRDGRVYYHIDAPSDAPTMRGFAGLLHVGLNGATPAAIAATPNDLCQQLGLQKALGGLRTRGLVALLRRVQRNAQDLAQTQ